VQVAQAPLKQASSAPELAPQKVEPPTAAAEPEASSTDNSQVIKRRGPDPGWSPLSIKDELPICLFTNLQEREKAPLLKGVKPQKLAANTPLTIGVYGPGCLSDACDDRPTLQCWIERESDDTFVVKTRFFSFHRDGAECTKDCMELDTACWTQEPLNAGKYKIRHGDKTYKLQLPSVVRDPCFGKS
jgi:hypothetical protein